MRRTTLALVLLSVAVSLPSAAGTLPPDLDPTITTGLGPREDAVGRHAGDPAATEVLIAVMKTDPAPDVRSRAAKALFDRWEKGIGDREVHKGAAVWAAASADPASRAGAVRALGDVGDDYTLVVGYLNDSDPQVSAAAYAAMERWATRHPDRAGEVHAILGNRELGTEGKVRRLFEKVKEKIP